MSKNKVKIWCYWFSVILPIIDIIKGAVTGIKNVYKDVHTEEERKRMDIIYTEMKERFYNDNK